MLRFARRLGAALAVVGCAASAAAPAQATFPGANGKVVFSKGGDLWTINPDGTGLAQVTSGPDTDTVPKWSPDGSAVAFERNELGFREAIQIGHQGNDIFIMRTGENPTEFGTYPDDDFAPTWSSDGRQLAYLTERNVQDQDPTSSAVNLVVANLDGSAHRVILTNDFPNVPDWSPLGSRIAYAYGYDLAYLNTIDVDGANKTQLTTYETIGDYDFSPSWSPDGSHIAFSRHRESENDCTPNETSCNTFSSLFVVDADGGDPQRLTSGVTRDSDPVWSPDGTQIAYVHHSEWDDPAEIWLMNADGSDPHFLADGTDPDWQPLIAPRHLDPPRVLGAPREGRGFAANRGLWLGTPPVAFTYQWALCDGDEQNCADIAGATDRVYTPTHEDVSHTLRVTVTATNHYGQGDGTSELSAPVGESLLGGSAGESLVGTAGSDLISGLGGPDRIALGMGNDVGQGGYGNDWVAGGDGNDFLNGGPGRDRLRGGSGRDRIYARDGYRDWISCGPRRDLVRADRRDRVASSCELVRYR